MQVRLSFVIEGGYWDVAESWAAELDGRDIVADCKHADQYCAAACEAIEQMRPFTK